MGGFIDLEFDYAAVNLEKLVFSLPAGSTDLCWREALRVYELFAFVIFEGVLWVVGKGLSFRFWCNWAS